MKKCKIFPIILFSIFLVLPFFLSNVKCVTTINDTTFPTNEGDTHTWLVTASPLNPQYLGQKINFTTDAIYKGQHASKDALIVNCTITLYNTTIDLWTIEHIGTYLAANETQNYLWFSSYFLVDFRALIIPTPINLQLVASTLSNSPRYTNHTINGNRLMIISDGGMTKHVFYYSTSGFATSLEGYFIEALAVRYELITPIDGDGGEIPFGYFFIIPSVISIVIVVLFVKKRHSIKIRKNI